MKLHVGLLLSLCGEGHSKNRLFAPGSGLGRGEKDHARFTYTVIVAEARSSLKMWTEMTKRSRNSPMQIRLS
jgi:hypothetical protein